MAEPTFSRIEIKLADNSDLTRARSKLLDLAADLRVIIKTDYSDDEKLILARHKIKTISQQLRNV